MATLKEFLEQEAAQTDEEILRAQTELTQEQDNVTFWQKKVAALTEASTHLKDAASKVDPKAVVEPGLIVRILRRGKPFQS